MQKNPIFSEIDFNKEGKQLGFLRLPHSVHRSAYGWIPIPIASIRNGEGPTVLIMAGNHGDEYEGQVIVAELMRQLDASMIAGHVILLPMANFPAAQAGKRTSPLDNGNLNRSFPGKADGTPTEIMAHYIEHMLLARCDYVLDLHSGGTSLRYDGANMLALAPRNETEKEHLFHLLNALGLPRAFLLDVNPVTISSAARRQNAISIVTELGGGAMITADILQQARQGVLHFLATLNILSGPLVPLEPPAKTHVMRIDGQSHYVYARDTGLFEPVVALGDNVQKGDVAGHIHFPSLPWKEPDTLYFQGDGVVICERAIAQVEPGDCVFQLAGSL